MSLKKLQHDKSIETSLKKEMKILRLNKDENIVNSIGLGASRYMCVCVCVCFETQQQTQLDKILTHPNQAHWHCYMNNHFPLKSYNYFENLYLVNVKNV
jgi:hypothetical protein